MKNLGKSLKIKYASATKIAKFICFALVLTVLNSCSTHQTNRLKHKDYKKWKSFQWTETKSNSNKDIAPWTIYSRKIKGTDFLEYKIEGEISTSPETCVVAFKQDIYHLVDKKDNKKYPTYELVHESENSMLTYVIHNEPFPFKNTEMSVRYLFSNDKEDDAKITWHEAWDESLVEASKKLNRVETFRGSWEFLKESNNKTKAVNTVQFDPKNMPKWLVNPMVTKFLRKGLENLRVSTIK